MFNADESITRIFNAADSCSPDDLRGPIREELERARREMRDACAALVDSMWVDASDECGLQVYGIGSNVASAADELAARMRALR